MEPLKDLLGIRGLDQQRIEDLLDLADTHSPLNVPTPDTAQRLPGRMLLNLFFEASTRTRTSFEIAAKRLGMEVINLVIGTTSIAKGETLRDTIMTIDAMKPDAVVVRHSVAGVPAYLARFSAAHFINAGDGSHEHPTQALLDALTLRQHVGRLAGIRIAILGDLLHSRVARSNIHLLTRMGAHVRLGGPRTLHAPFPETLADDAPGSLILCDTVDEAVTDADAVMLLRIQRERQNSAFLPSLKEYFRFYGLTPDRLKLARPEAPILHPGPINRDVEIASDLADSPNSRILDQVANGVAVRMAVLEYLIKGSDVCSTEKS